MRFETSDEPFAHDVLVRLEAATSDVYLELLKDLPPDEARRMVKVLDAVFDSSLRAWSAGRSSTADLRRTISDAVELLLKGPDRNGAPGGTRPR